MRDEITNHECLLQFLAVPKLVRIVIRPLSLLFPWFTVASWMLDHTETLQIGQRAPEFALEAANRPGVLTLSGFLRRGALVAEFLRGTW
jgi:hypothetical protein